MFKLSSFRHHFMFSFAILMTGFHLDLEIEGVVRRLSAITVTCC